MSPISLRDFLRVHPGMTLVDADRAIPEALLERVSKGINRLVLAKDGVAIAAVVTLADLDLLEITDHGFEVVAEPLQIG